MSILKAEDADRHDEFDFFYAPHVKAQLLELDKKMKELPADERLYEFENYAARRGLYTFYVTAIFEIDGMKHKMVKEGKVVMPGFERYRNAYMWLLKLRALTKEEQEKNVPLSSDANLPF